MLKRSEVDLSLDSYGEGPAIDILETQFADLLGKERAMFVHKGMVGQLCALKRWSELKHSHTIAIHPQCHLEVDEALAYQELLSLNAIKFGHPYQANTTEDVDDLPTKLAAVAVELPIRRAGFQLPEWHVLENIKSFTQANNSALHFDGARLFESAGYWNKTYSQVAALAYSVYVSLYKGLGALAGGIIAGDDHFIESLRPWKTRFGGDIHSVFPLVLSALWGVEHYLPRIPDFRTRATSLATAIEKSFGAHALPFAVQTNSFVVELPVAPEQLTEAALRFACKDKIWLFDRLMPTDNHYSRFEIQVGDAADDWSDDEICETLQAAISIARAG
jgi:threonine aldolase